jgi:hypothetical protein
MLSILYNFIRNFSSIFEKIKKIVYNNVERVLVTVTDSVGECSDRQTDLSTL